jgi:hypothetical protein
LFYDARQRVRCKANATLHTNDALSNDRWKATSPQARLGYMTLDLQTRGQINQLLDMKNFAITKPTDEKATLLKKTLL